MPEDNDEFLAASASSHYLYLIKGSKLVFLFVHEVIFFIHGTVCESFGASQAAH
jgi:hypothetical protein